MHNVTHLHHIPGVFHEAVGKLRNMHQAVLMHTDVNKGSESRHVRDDALKLHARGEILKFVHTFGKLGRFKFRTRIAPRLFQFDNDVGHCRKPKTVIREVCGIKTVKHFRVADQRSHGKSRLFNDFFNHRIRLGVYGRGVQRICPARNSQKARGLLKRLGAEPWHVHQRLTVGKSAVGVTVGNNGFGLRGAQSGNTPQKSG